MDDVSKVLEAIGALDAKVDVVRGDIAGLKKTDEHLASEVHRIGEDQRNVRRELLEMKAETLRTFESERHASQQTVRAITKHVDEAAQAFHSKAADIDALKVDVAEVMAINVEQNETLKTIAKHFTGIMSHPKAKQLAALVLTILIAWLTAKAQGLLK